MGTVITPEHTIFQGLIEELMRPQRVASAGNKIALARAEGEHLGRISGITTALAEVGNAERIRLMGPLFLPGDGRRWVPALTEYDVLSWVRGLKEAWDNGDFKEMDDDEFYAGAWAQFVEVVVNEGDFPGTVRKMREDALVAGAIEPTPDDVDWLRERVETFSGLADPYRHALEKAQLAKRHADERAELDRH